MYVCVFLVFPQTVRPKVKVLGKIVTRDGMVNNERALSLAINHLGSRVSVDVVYLDIQSFYNFVQIPIDSSMDAIFSFPKYGATSRFANIYINYANNPATYKVALLTIKPGISGDSCRCTTTLFAGLIFLESSRFDGSWQLQG